MPSAISRGIETLPNPVKSGRRYVVRIVTSDVTWVGKREGDVEQPDFGQLTIEYVPNELIAELKSVKLWIGSLRERLFSYERLANTLFDEFRAAVQPNQLMIRIACHPRGGASTTVEVGTTEQW